MSVGAGVISDIYRMEERGSAIGFFFAVRVFSFLSFGRRVVLRAWEKRKGKKKKRADARPSCGVCVFLLGEPPWPVALADIGRARGAVCVVARPAARAGLVRRGAVRHGVAVHAGNELATRTRYRQATRSG